MNSRRRVNSTVRHLQLMFYKLAISLTLIVTASFTYGGDKSNVEELTGVVVAYPDLIAQAPCYKDCEGSLILRIDSANGKTSYVRLDVKYRRGRFPDQLIHMNARWLFRAIRTPSRDEPLY
jgi:hypothetical protein